jgi:hypothetical protein
MKHLHEHSNRGGRRHLRGCGLELTEAVEDHQADDESPEDHCSNDEGQTSPPRPRPGARISSAGLFAKRA